MRKADVRHVPALYFEAGVNGEQMPAENKSVRWTRMRKRKIGLTALTFLLLAVCVLSGVMIWRELSGRQKDIDNFNYLAELVTPEDSGPEPPADAGGGAAQGDEGDGAGDLPHVRDLTPLFEQNGECVGWVCIPDTGLDYPVMYTPEDPQKYLRLNFYGEYSVSGVPFLDGRCGAASDNLIIYGHDMRNGTMFGSLKQYTGQDYLLEHPSVEFETGAGCVRYEVFAVAVVGKADDWYQFIEAGDEAAYEEQIAYIREKALLTTETVPAYGSRLLTLSTCYGSGGNDRLLVIAAAAGTMG